MSRSPSAEVSPFADITLTAQVIKLLRAMPVEQTIGVCCAMLQHAADQEPDLVRRVLNDPIIKQGYRGTTLLAELQRVAR